MSVMIDGHHHFHGDIPSFIACFVAIALINLVQFSLTSVAAWVHITSQVAIALVTIYYIVKKNKTK